MAQPIKHYIKWDDELLICSQAGERLGVTGAVVSSWCREHNCKTKEQLLARQKKLADNKKGLSCKMYDTIYGRMSVKQLWVQHEHKHEVTMQMIRNRGNRYGFMSPVIDYPKYGLKEFNKQLITDGIVEPIVTEKKVSNLKHDRGKICHRFGKNERCKHYVYCADQRLLGKQSDKFVEGGSCYDGELVKPSRIQGRGQINDAVQHTVNRY